MRKAILLAAVLALTACAPQKHAYKVTFTNGDYEIYELNYKPKAGAKTVEVDGETILGVENIEKIK